VIDGVYVVDKPGGLTSHDVVAKLRRQLGTRAIGHAGTLDPMATGVLLLLAGEATKLSPYLTLETKSYRAEVRFGLATDTLDTDGRVEREVAVPPGSLGRAALAAAFEAERARSEQTPPVISAIQVGGERSHRLARRGEAPDLPARPVRVVRLELGAVLDDRIELEVTASKGYYVRALARDLGERLGLPACLSALRRTESGGFSLAEALPWPVPDGAVPLSVLAAARRCLPSVELSAEGAQRARLGQALSLEHFVVPPPADGPAAWTREETLIAVGARRDESFRVLRGFGRR
jgi:tRNA pseudouridine55 synthase